MRAKFVNEGVKGETRIRKLQQRKWDLMEELNEIIDRWGKDSFAYHQTRKALDNTLEELRKFGIRESQNFERGQDPKKSLGLGINNFYDYVNIQAKKVGLDPDDFWEERYNYAREEDGADILDELYNVLLKTPIDYQIEYFRDSVEDWIEDNSELIESVNFERGLDPKKSLGLGLDCEKYVKLRLSKTPYNTEDDEEGFWDLFFASFEDMRKDEIGDHIIHILDKSFNNPKYMIEYMDSEIENYIQFRKETD